MNKILIVMIVVLLLAIGIPLLSKQKTHEKAETLKTDIATTTVKQSENFSWSFAEVEDKKSGEVSTKVTLHTETREYDAGTYQGSCSVIEKSKLADANEVSAVLCWFAGFGDEVGVFRDGDRLMVKHGEIQEGTAEDPAFRGEFKVILSL